MTGPQRKTLLGVIGRAVTVLDEMVGRWSDGIPAPVRDEIKAVRDDLEKPLIAAGVRGQVGGVR